MMMSGGGGGRRCLFTASQWQELEQQALIFKYMAAGSEVPHELVVACGVPSSSSLLFPPSPHSLGWGCYGAAAAAQYGRKAEDLEPGRCRRTDGKKWRCSREAYGESKYCDKHMHRGKNRSRKPVEAASFSGAGDSYRPSALSISPPTADAPTYGYHHHHHHLCPNASAAARGAAAAPLQLHFGTTAAAHTAAAASPPPSYQRYAAARQQHNLALGADLSMDKPNPAASSLSRKTEEKPLHRFFVDDWPRDDGRAPWMMDHHQLLQDETQLSISISMAPSDVATADASRRHHHHNNNHANE